MKNPTILYWKWDEQIFDPGVMDAKLNDILLRSSFSMIYVSFHHLGRPFEDAELLALISRCANRLSMAGRRLILDIDVRNETEGLIKSIPRGAAKYIRFYQCALPDTGIGRMVTDHPERGRTGRRTLKSGPVRIAGCWSFEPGGPGRYKKGTLCAARCQYETHGDATTFFIEADPNQSPRQALIAAVYEAAIPDLAADATFAYYESLFKRVAGLPLGGAANDEWGYDLVLQWEDGLYFVEDFPYTDTLADAYQIASGHLLDDDCVHLAYAEEGCEGRAYGVVNLYLKLMRQQMRKGNDWFYNAVKRHFGPGAFVGVHPTLWGDPTDFVLDAPHNGISWWETRRDYAQTDEFVLMPIRLALAHKWSGGDHPVFYNMWYSGNTQQFDTYLEETWRNARFGGRTHYLGYECPNEGGVYKLKHPGSLEAVARMERQIARLDDFQASLPDCRVLVIFGVEAASNWLLAGGGPRVVRNQGVLKDVLHYSAALFDHYLCDLVPSSEISNESVILDNGVVRYGRQVYDALVWIAPENTEPVVHAFFSRYAAEVGRLITVGNGRYFSNGSDAGEALSAALCDISCHLNRMDGIAYTTEILRSWNVPQNRSAHGAVFQDGSLLFTCDGRLPDQNLLDFTEALAGHLVRFRGEDFLGLRFDKKGQVAHYVAGKAYYLSVDGVEIHRETICMPYRQGI